MTVQIFIIELGRRLEAKTSRKDFALRNVNSIWKVSI